MFVFLAWTYSVAAQLPSFVLDTLLNIPYFLISIRNRLLPVEPFVRPTPEVPLPPLEAPAVPVKPSSKGDESPDSSAEADVESNADSVDSSWISLQDEQRGETLDSADKA